MNILQLKQITTDGRTKVWKIHQKNTLMTFGTSRKSDLVSIDKNSPTFEAALEFRDDGWHFIQWSTQAENADLHITDKSQIQLNGSKLSFEVIQKEEFVQPLLNNYQSRGSEKRQILIVSKNGRLLKTDIKPLGYKFNYTINGEKQDLPFNNESAWKQHFIEGFEFKSKMIEVEDLNGLAHMSSDQLADKESKKMLVITLAAMFFFVGIGLLGTKKIEPVAEIPIQTATLVTMPTPTKKTEKPKSAQKVATATPQAAPKNDAAAGGGSNKVNAMLKGAIGARISQLIGKVSATEARTANVLVTKGTVAGEGASGRALAAVGRVDASGRNWNGEAVGSGKGVGTAGVGGGKGVAGLGNGLSAGKTGSGGVGLIEEESEVEGGLDREVIAQYIKTQLGQILYCYERQLSANPDLYGKVAVKFTIGGTGHVISQLIGDSTLKSQPVEGCILNKVSKWKFPEPKGGTKVVVTYPFLFKSTN